MIFNAMDYYLIIVIWALEEKLTKGKIKFKLRYVMLCYGRRWKTSFTLSTVSPPSCDIRSSELF